MIDELKYNSRTGMFENKDAENDGVERLELSINGKRMYFDARTGLFKQVPLNDLSAEIAKEECNGQ